MTIYKIIRVDKNWIVCDGQARLIAFERRSLARQTAHDAEELLRAIEQRVKINSAVDEKAA
jgi:hypothetical protein